MTIKTHSIFTAQTNNSCNTKNKLNKKDLSYIQQSVLNNTQSALTSEILIVYIYTNYLF